MSAFPNQIFLKMSNPTNSSASVSSVNVDENVVSIQSLKMQRAAVKWKITCALRRISGGSNVNLAANLKMIESYLVKVNSYDDRINEVICNGISKGQLEDLQGNGLDSQADYTLDIQNKISSFSVCPATSNHVNVLTLNQIPQNKIKLPELKCQTFNGEGTSILQYLSFKIQYQTLINLKTDISITTKLMYLSTILKGHAYKLIQQLSVINDNYEITLQTKTHYLMIYSQNFWN